MNLVNIWLKRTANILAVTFCFSVASAEDNAGTSSTTAVRHVTANQARPMAADTNVIVLDIRTPGEFAAGHIAGATNINFRAADFEKNLAALDKSKTYLLHCATGNRTTQALPMFKKLEFKSICHLDGGIKGWEKAGLPVQK